MNRALLLMLFGCALLALIGGAFLFFKPAISHVRSSVSIQVIAYGNQSGAFDTRKNFHLETEDQFSTLWNMLYGANAPVLPEVDFSKNEVLAVFDGTHTSGGYAISVTNVVDRGGRRSISIEHVAPNTSCIVTQSITSPYQLVVIPKSSLPITRIDTQNTAACK